eukprot:scaffold20053_cov117-Cylindrotheca_fusiformis.AAC.1
MAVTNLGHLEIYGHRTFRSTKSEVEQVEPLNDGDRQLRGEQGEIPEKQTKKQTYHAAKIAEATLL